MDIVLERFSLTYSNTIAVKDFNLQIVAMQRASEYLSVAIAIDGHFSAASNASFSCVCSFPHSMTIERYSLH